MQDRAAADDLDFRHEVPSTCLLQPFVLMSVRQLPYALRIAKCSADASKAERSSGEPGAAGGVDALSSKTSVDERMVPIQGLEHLESLDEIRQGYLRLLLRIAYAMTGHACCVQNGVAEGYHSSLMAPAPSDSRESGSAGG